MVQSADLPRLRDRDTELAMIDDWLAGSPRGGGRVLLVEGDAGIGKTRVLEALTRNAASTGFTVFAGRADEVERTRPFGPLVEALLAGAEDAEAARSEVVALLDAAVSHPSDDPGLQFRVVDGFVALVESIALERPVLLVVDDLQWADASTLVTLNSVARRLDYLDLRLAVGLRPVPRSLELTQFVDASLGRGAEHLCLKSLGESAAAELVADLVGAPPGPTLRAAVAGAAGNPLFITELVRALREESGIEISGGQADTDAATVPPSVHLTILRRLAFLGDDSLEFLRNASLLGSAFTLRDLSVVMDTRLATLAENVDEPVQAGLIEERDERLWFRHDLIREAIYGDMLEDVRAAAHLEAGRRLEKAGAPSLQVAEQLALGAQPGDTDAVTRLHEAARAVAMQAPSVAADLLEHALDLIVGPGDPRMAILADLVQALLWAGRPGDAASRAEEAIALVADTDLGASFRLGLVQALAAQGRFDDLIEVVDRVLAVMRPAPDFAAQLQAEAANASLFTGDFDDAARRAEEAITVGFPVGSEGAVAGLLVLSDIARGRGVFEEALRLAEEASLRSSTRVSVRRGWGPEIFAAMALRGLDRFAEADQAIQRGRRADELLGRVSYLPVYSYEAAGGRYAEGRWDEAVFEAEAGLALADEVGLVMLRSWPGAILTLIALHRGDVAGASDRLARIDDRDRPDDPTSEPTLLATARGLVQEATGDGMGALETLRRAFDATVERGVVSAYRALAPNLVRLALAHGDRDLASSVAASVEDSVQRGPVPSVRASALFCRGMVDGDPGPLLEAVAAYEASPRRFDTALAAEAAAEALADGGRVAEARDHFERALTDLEAMGADHHVGRILGTMRRLGMGRRRRSRHARAVYGWEALTPSELEVVRLAAEGLTNRKIGGRLFISPRTVQTHLSHAFRKLDITSRVQLATEVTKRGIALSPPSPRDSPD